MKHLVKTDSIATLEAVDYGRVVYESSSDKVWLQFPTIDGYVDLGLPSGLKWATCNVGANSPEEYGKFFQWGDTVGYYEGQGAAEHSTWQTCPFNNGASSYNATYFASVSGTVCPNGVLAAKYDAAHVRMGGKWRMPTSGDAQELIDNTTATRTTINGVNGVTLTSKKDTSKSIFIPSSGVFVYGEYGYVGNLGGILTSNFGYDEFGGYGAYVLATVSEDDVDENIGLTINPLVYSFNVRGVLPKS